MSDLGDFKLKLGILTDDNAFNKAMGSIDSIASSVSHLTGMVRAAAAVLAVDMFGKVETQELKTAAALNISTEALEKWKFAARMTNTDATGLISSMTTLEQKMLDYKLGRGFDSNLAIDLGMLDSSLNMQTFADMDADQRLQTIIKTAEAMKDQTEAARLVGRILGSSAQEFYYGMKLSGKSFDEIMKSSQNMVLTNDSTKQNAFNMMSEWNQLTGYTEQLGKLLGSEISPGFTEFLAMLKDLAQDELVIEFIKGLGNAVSNLFSGLAKFTPTVIKTTASLFDTFAAGYKGLAYYMVGDIKNGDKFMKQMSDGATEMAKNTWASLFGEESLNQIDEGVKKAEFNKQLEDAKKASKNSTTITTEQQQMLKLLDGLNSGQSVNDGIIKPNGQVVSVAQDDWVFAVKDIAKLAAAFAPKPATVSNRGGDIVVNQNFTISGTSDIPGTLKQQAFKGTQEALIPYLQGSTVRIQNMPGLI